MVEDVKTKEPDLSVMPAVRQRLAMAEEQLQIAAKTLRQGGWPDTAHEVTKLLKLSRVLTQKDGWLDWMEKPQ